MCWTVLTHVFISVLCLSDDDLYLMLVCLVIHPLLIHNMHLKLEINIYLFIFYVIKSSPVTDLITQKATVLVLSYSALRLFSSACYMKFTDQGVSRMKQFNLPRPALFSTCNAQLRPVSVKYESSKDQKIFSNYFFMS